MANTDIYSAGNLAMPRFDTPFDLAQGVNTIRSGQMENALTRRKIQGQNALAGLMKQHQGNPEQVKQGLIDQGLGDQAPAYETQQNEAEKTHIEMALKRTEYAAQVFGQFIDQPPTPEVDAQYRQVKAGLEKEFGHPLQGMPDNYDPVQFKNGYTQGLQSLKGLREKAQIISTTGGFYNVNAGTGQLSQLTDPNTGQPLLAPNASPELAGQMQQQKEMFKGVKATNEQGQEYYAPQGEVNPAFANPGNMRPQGQDTGFQQFNSPEEGLQAIDKNLQAYGSKGVNTLAGVISRWSPPNENDTQGLIKSASSRLGLDPNQPIDLGNPLARHAIASAIMLQEHGAKGIFGGGVVKSPSLEQKNQADINKTQQIEQVKNQAELGKQQQIKVRDSKEAMTLLGNIKRLLPVSTGSGFGAQVDATGDYIGRATEGSKAISALATDAKKLVMMMPRGAGPQSDRDVALAEQMSGDLANPKLPVEKRQAALAELERIFSQYIPGADVGPGYNPGATTQQPTQSGARQPTISNW